MVNTCPYCGEEQRALKNHVRLATGDGHGPNGQYPEDFGDRPDQGDDPDPGGGIETTPAREGEPDDLPEVPPEPTGGGGAVAVEAVQDADAEDGADEEDSLIAMPESELNQMLEEAGDSERGKEEESETEISGEAEGEWGLAAVLVMVALAALTGVVWGVITDKDKNGRHSAHELTSRGDPAMAGV